MTIRHSAIALNRSSRPPWTHAVFQFIREGDGLRLGHLLSDKLRAYAKNTEDDFCTFYFVMLDSRHLVHSPYKVCVKLYMILFVRGVVLLSMPRQHKIVINNHSCRSLSAFHMELNRCNAVLYFLSSFKSVTHTDVQLCHFFNNKDPFK